MIKLGDKKPKVCFAASAGGHLEQILMLRPLIERYDGFIVTEKTAYEINVKGIRCYYLMQVNRLEKKCIFRLIVNTFLSLKVFLKERPDVIICTGVLATIPICLLCKFFGRKLVFIESFAKVTSPTLTGKFLYRFADRFYVQWPEMLEHYPQAMYLGGIY